MRLMSPIALSRRSYVVARMLYFVCRIFHSTALRAWPELAEWGGLKTCRVLYVVRDGNQRSRVGSLRSLEVRHPGGFGLPVGQRRRQTKIPGPSQPPQFFEPDFPGRVVQKDAVDGLFMPVEAEAVHGIRVGGEPLPVIAGRGVVIFRPGTEKPAVQKQRNRRAVFHIDRPPVVFSRLAIQRVLPGHIDPVVDAVTAVRTDRPPVFVRRHTDLAPGGKGVAPGFERAAGPVQRLNPCRHRAASYVLLSIVVVV
jgi:hypothetical protein